MGDEAKQYTNVEIVKYEVVGIIFTRALTPGQNWYLKKNRYITDWFLYTFFFIKKALFSKVILP